MATGRVWIAGLLVTGAAALFLGGCVSVPSGYRAVVVGPRGSVGQLGEGAFFVAPFSQTCLYDARSLEANEDFAALTADGAPVKAGSSLVTYRLPPDELGALNQATGPAYYRTLIQPILRSAARRVLARYGWNQLLDPANVLRVQKDLTTDAAQRLRPRHVILDSIVLRGIFLDLPKTSAAVTDTGVWEQKALKAREEVLVAEQKARARQAAAGGVASANDRVRPTLTAGMLEDEDRRAWSRLLESPSVRIEAVEDGQSPVVEVEQ